MTPDRYPVPATRHRVEQTLRRSRFLTTVGRAATAEVARHFVEEIRAEFPDATHHCWAFIAGPPGSSHTVGMSDDGEPHGTAGRPMLEALSHSGVGEVVAVCTRWYGGTKLGTGGLSRAYSGGVVKALESLPTVERVETVRLRVTLDYAAADPLRRSLADLEARIAEEAYGAEVCLTLVIPREHRARLERFVADLSSGSGRVRDV